MLYLGKTTEAFAKLEPHRDEAEQERHEQQDDIDDDSPRQGISLNRFRLHIVAHSDSFGQVITATLGESGYLTKHTGRMSLDKVRSLLAAAQLADRLHLDFLNLNQSFPRVREKITLQAFFYSFPLPTYCSRTSIFREIRSTAAIAWKRRR